LANKLVKKQVKQEGAAMVEFAVTVSLFLILVLAIAEFAIVIMTISRANEATRQLSRIVIVSSPLCDVFGGGCPGGALTCPGGTAVVVDLDTIGVDSCGTDLTSTECRMYNTAQGYLPGIAADQIEVTYACSLAGSDVRPETVPFITVAIRNFSHQFAVGGFLGINATMNIPDFEITRTGEDLYTERDL